MWTLFNVDLYICRQKLDIRFWPTGAYCRSTAIDFNFGPSGRRSCMSRILWCLQGLVHKMETSAQTAKWLWQRGSTCMSNHVHQAYCLSRTSAWTCTIKIKCPTTLRREETTICEDTDLTKRKGRDQQDDGILREGHGKSQPGRNKQSVKHVVSLVNEK